MRRGGHLVHKIKNILDERRGGHLVHKIKNILDERRGGRFFDREEGGPLLYAFGESYGERVGWRRGVEGVKPNSNQLLCHS